MTDRWLLIDTASLYFRAYFGVPKTVRAPSVDDDTSGQTINAAHGLLDMLTRLVDSYRPTHLVCAWDEAWRPAWRVALLPSYKAHRVAQIAADGNPIETVEAELEAQIPIIADTLNALGLCVVGAADAEADDVIGTLARANSAADIATIVVTGDRDLFQLVDDHTRVAYVARGVANHELVDNAWLASKYGIIGAQYADFATLRGDASDGLPGVSGVGEKTAASLLAKYGDLDGILAAAGDDGSELAGGLRHKLLAADDYLRRARPVVKTRDLPGLAVADAAVVSRQPDRAHTELIGTQFGLTGAINRLSDALEDVEDSAGA